MIRSSSYAGLMVSGRIEVRRVPIVYRCFIIVGMDSIRRIPYCPCFSGSQGRRRLLHPDPSLAYQQQQTALACVWQALDRYLAVEIDVELSACTQAGNSYCRSEGRSQQLSVAGIVRVGYLWGSSRDQGSRLSSLWTLENVLFPPIHRLEARLNVI